LALTVRAAKGLKSRRVGMEAKQWIEN